MNDRVAGLILAGGQSRRMGGQDKCLMKLNGTPLVEHVSNRLNKKLSPILINTNANPADFAYLGHNIKHDIFDGFAGPLAGILTGMRWAQDIGNIEWILTAATDTPFFPDNYPDKMFSEAQNNDIILAASNGRKHPVFGLWRVSLADELQGFLENGDRKVMLFVQNYRHHTEEFAIEALDPFFNLNTPEDWNIAEQIVMDDNRD